MAKRNSSKAPAAARRTVVLRNGQRRVIDVDEAVRLFETKAARPAVRGDFRIAPDAP